MSFRDKRFCSYNYKIAAPVNVLEMDAILKWSDEFIGILAYKSANPTATFIFPIEGI